MWLACLLYSIGRHPLAVYTLSGKCIFPNGEGELFSWDLGYGTYFAGFIHLFIHTTFTELLQRQSKLAGAGMIALQDLVL